MAMFDIAMSKAFALEGGYVNNPNDPGGPTKYGISLRWLASTGQRINGHDVGDVNGDGVIDLKDIQGLTKEEAAALYKRMWWDRYQYGLMMQPLAEKIFCEAINMGAPPAHRCLQQALLSHSCPSVVEDGILGKDTMQAVRLVQSRESVAALLATYKACIVAHYRVIAAKNPRLTKFLDGWINRANA